MASSASLQCHSNKMSILLRLPPGETLRAASSKLGQIFMFLSLYSDSLSSSSSLPHKHTFYTGSTSFIFSNLKLRQLWFTVWWILPCWWGRLFSLFSVGCTHSSLEPVCPTEQNCRVKVQTITSQIIVPFPTTENNNKKNIFDALKLFCMSHKEDGMIKTSVSNLLCFGI